jgi:hypothetical protein
MQDSKKKLVVLIKKQNWEQSKVVRKDLLDLCYVVKVRKVLWKT